MNPGSSLLATIIPLPVLLPLLGAGLTLVLARRPTLQRAVSVTVLSAVVVIAALLLVAAVQSGPIVITVGSWPVPLGITLVVDPLSALMLLTSMSVTLAVLVYAIGQGVYDRDETTPITIFHPTYLVLAAGVANAFLSGDLFNLYVGFEVLLMASYVLLTLGGSRSRVRAGVTYVVVNVVSSLIFLVGIALVYAAVGTLNLAQISVRMGDVSPGTALTIHLVLLTAFGIKAAVFPLSAWLPDSYPTAAAPVTAVFAGLLTKVGVYSIIRMETLVFPDSEATQTILLVAAGLTMLVGALGAVAQADIKRVLSFTLVSHIGYMIFGIALASPLGVAGAVFYVVHHITVQATLFCVVGLIEGVGGSTSVTRLGGLAKASPLLAILWFVPAINLGGIPPLSGFVGKLGLIQAGVADGSTLAWVLVVVAVLTSLLTLYAVTKVWVLAFWRPADQIPVAEVDEPEEPEDPDEEPLDEDTSHPDDVGGSRIGLPGAPTPRSGVLTGVRPGTAQTLADREANTGAEVDWPVARLAPGDSSPVFTGRFLGVAGNRVSRSLPRVMAGATAALVTLGLALTVVAGPLYAVADQAAADLVARTPYVQAVFAQTVDDRVGR
ncbi:MAG TPA: Na+/H+ antiporter subunit D [Actinomycetospora sp.]|nr:Na+/H+ antiporter subunit D [Actinomycetospora sp.]